MIKDLKVVAPFSLYIVSTIILLSVIVTMSYSQASMLAKGLTVIPLFIMLDFALIGMIYSFKRVVKMYKEIK